MFTHTTPSAGPSAGPSADPSASPARPRLPRPGRTASIAAGLALAALGTTTLAPVAEADVVTAEWFGETDFGYRIIHMPDFDQRRNNGPDGSIPGLPNNGAMYCVPASVMNMTAYVAQHGFPTVAPGNLAWWSNATYDDATFALQAFGAIAGTDPIDGTSLNGGRDVANAALPGFPLFIVSTQGIDGIYGPRVADIATIGIMGGLVGLCHGWWNQVGSSGGFPIVERGGGHCMTVTGAYAGFFEQRLTVRDPADDSGNQTQSTFVDREYCWEPEVIFIDGSPIPRLVDRIRPADDCEDTAMRYIDGLIIILPLPGILQPFDGPLQLQFAPSGVIDLTPDPIIFPEVAGMFTEAILGPDFTRVYAVVENDEGTAALICTHTLDREWTQLENVPLTPGAQMAFAPNRCLYVLSDGQLMKVLADVEVPDVVASTPVPFPNPPFTIDTTREEILIIDPSSGRLARYDENVEGPLSLVTIPGLLPIPADAELHHDPASDSLWYLEPGNPVVLQITGTEAGEPEVTEIELPGLIGPRSMDVADNGMLLVVDGEIWKAYTQDADGVWKRNEDAPFDGTEAGQLARVGTSTSNWDPEIHDPEQWRNVLPESFGAPVLDCLADFDADGTVGFSDLLTLLAAWGPCDPTFYCDADLDFDGTVGFADLLSVLAAWGDCP